MNVSILYGGWSAEHKISIQTGLAVAGAIREDYNIDLVDFTKSIFYSPQFLLESDIVFNALHGGAGEDGTIQSFFELHNIAYTGSNSKASKIAMDKNIAKLLVKSVGVRTPRWVVIKNEPGAGVKFFDQNSERFSFPFIVKPATEGSTYGISFVGDDSGLSEAINKAAAFSRDVIVEEYIEGRELTVGILDGKVLPIIEIKPANKIFDFECKYSEGKSAYVVPADINESIERKISEDSLKIFNVIGCRHYGRIDFRLDSDGNYYFLELNTLPGMTSTSLFPKAAEKVDISYSELIEQIINRALND